MKFQYCFALVLSLLFIQCEEDSTINMDKDTPISHINTPCGPFLEDGSKTSTPRTQKSDLGHQNLYTNSPIIVW